MKIISNFNDYYDQCTDRFQAFEQDIIFNRFTKKIDTLTTLKLKEANNFNTIKRIDNLVFFCIIFCGIIYKGVKIEKPNNIEIAYTRNGALYLSKQSFNLIDIHFNNQFEKAYPKLIEKPIYLVYPSRIFNFIEIYENPKLTDFNFYKTISPMNVYLKIEDFLKR